MKLPLYVLSFLVLAHPLISSAQSGPATGSAYKPTPNREYMLNIVTADSIRLTSGANQTWRVNLRSAPSPIQLTVLDGPGTPPLSALESADYLIRLLPSNDVDQVGYLRYSDSEGLRDMGTCAACASAPSTFTWVQAFPAGSPRIPARMSLNGVYIQRYRRIDTTNFASKTFGYQADTVVYKRYGNLVLNGSVYPDCIYLQKRRTTVLYDADSTQPPAFSSYTVADEVYAPGVGYPILRSQRIPFNTTVNYLSGVATGISVPAATLPATVYPSPTEGIFKIANPAAEPAQIEVYDPLGRHLKSLPYTQGQADASALPPGLYSIRFQQDGKSYRGRLVRR